MYSISEIKRLKKTNERATSFTSLKKDRAHLALFAPRNPRVFSIQRSNWERCNYFGGCIVTKC